MGTSYCLKGILEVRPREPRSSLCLSRSGAGGWRVGVERTAHYLSTCLPLPMDHIPLTRGGDAAVAPVRCLGLCQYGARGATAVHTTSASLVCVQRPFGAHQSSTPLPTSVLVLGVGGRRALDGCEWASLPSAGPWTSNRRRGGCTLPPPIQFGVVARVVYTHVARLIGLGAAAPHRPTGRAVFHGRLDRVPSTADVVGLHCRPLSHVPIPPAMSAAWAWDSPVRWLGWYMHTSLGCLVAGPLHLIRMHDGPSCVFAWACESLVWTAFRRPPILWHRSPIPLPAFPPHLPYRLPGPGTRWCGGLGGACTCRSAVGFG